MDKNVLTIGLLLLLLLAVVAPFSALSGLMLIVVGSLVYGLVAAVIKAIATPEGSEDT